MEAKQRELWARMMAEETGELESLETFIFEFMRTKDPADPHPAGKRIERKPYIRDFLRVWLAERLLAVSKSRQMLVTWLCVGCYCWDTYRHIDRFTVFKSLDRLHAGLEEPNLLWRAQYIHDHLPRCVQPRMKVKKRALMLQYPDTNGTIIGCSMEAADSRSWTPTGCLDDELAIQQHGEGGFTAVKAGLGTTGRYTAVSTPLGENFWERLVHDKLDE